MYDIKSELAQLKNTRSVQRARREKSSIPVVALVGYTNSGKSALMNRILALTEKEEKTVFEKNMLFATLDTQQRSVVLSLKMAEAAAAARITGEHPVLLLDDVLSELDEGRKQYLLTRMKEKQTFVTSCDDTAFLKTDGEVYRMNGGVLSRA